MEKVGEIISEISLGIYTNPYQFPHKKIHKDLDYAYLESQSVMYDTLMTY